MDLKLGSVWIYLIVVLCHMIPLTKSENIVFFFGVSTYSHRVPAWPLAEALAENGHNVTFVSPFPSKSPNPKIYDYVPKILKEWVESWEDLEDVFSDRKTKNPISMWLMLPTFGIMMCEEIYKDEDFIRWVKSTKVDVVFLDALANDCAYGMVHYWDAKLILYNTAFPFAHFADVYGLPDESSSMPGVELAFPIDMSFSQRLVNALFPIAYNFYRKWTFFPELEEITRDKLGITNLPKFHEIERNTSLVFINAHYGEEFSRSLPPNVVSIGGIAYTGKRKPLPKDIAQFLEKSDGFIYISFGTYADFLQMDKPTQQAFIGAMRSLSHIQFLWKVDDLSLINEFPDNNVFISKWMPQQDILAHPKIRAFITHAGLVGLQEAIYNSVPLISFPIFGDQDYNAERIHRKEYGIRLEITTVTQVQLEDAINKILTDNKYRDNMKKVTSLFTDRPQNPLDTALWWTDFVIRHNKEELATLRPLTVGLSWWKRRQLDVWITVFGSLTALLSLIIYLLYKLLKFTFSTSSTKTVSSHGKKTQ
ncbi:UDP-glucosyltransferase 2 [Pseudolycoriella hygida]|uniref:UDP-glucuronosyltransferase n=1 Tax=Pseudolycoriella hygida TaxID=35572 RepID=A0A9Q0N4W6_9DIPT|nr:UDP-glucosyltransferase 2 [Pseudolycoriella hygida]